MVIGCQRGLVVELGENFFLFFTSIDPNKKSSKNFLNPFPIWKNPVGQVLHNKTRGRYSRSGSTLLHQVTPGTNSAHNDSLSYAKRTQEGIPPDLLALSSRLEEVQQKKKLIFTNVVSREERRDFFIHELCDGNPSELRLMAFDLIDCTIFTVLMLTLIVINSVTMVINAWTPESRIKYGYYCDMFEPIFLSLYVFEAVMKIYAKRVHYFQNGWDLFDFIIVLTALSDMFVNVFRENGLDLELIYRVDSQSNQSSTSNAQGSLFLGKIFKVVKITRVLKSMRSMKLMRLIKLNDKLLSLWRTILNSIHSLTHIVAFIMMSLIFFSVLMYLRCFWGCEVSQF